MAETGAKHRSTEEYKRDLVKQVQSLENTRDLPDESVIYPGHGKKSTIGYEKANNPYLL